MFVYAMIDRREQTLNVLQKKENNVPRSKQQPVGKSHKIFVWNFPFPRKVFRF